VVVVVVGQQEFVLANVSRPEPGRALALHQVRLQLVDEADRAVPLEQVYRSYMVLSASADDHDSANSSDNAHGEGRVLVALGPEGSKESVRLPQGYYIHSPEVQTHTARACVWREETARKELTTWRPTLLDWSVLVGWLVA
jgi:hypothetical protein